jgi:FKBP-type peptidyl-prolyl cis-trans isomerase SlyD
MAQGSDDRQKIQDNMVVSLDYAVSLENGEVVDHSAKDEPLQFMQGHGQIIPGLEQELYGMEVGEKKRVVVEPSEAYGEKDPQAVQVVPRDVFPGDLELDEGMRLNMQDQSGRTFTAFVEEVREEDVVLDFNHPLAGEKLQFDVRVVDVRPATDDELSHGHVHDE